ncbi:MAG: hypothetical protein ACI9JK_001151 [Phycisphaerales bacterium]|jgi:hypothetical protein
MLSKLTTYMILSAIAVQAVFGGLQSTVSICLGGGHEHEVAEVVEHCSHECSHHDQWVTPVTEDQDVQGCACTDLELALIDLVTTPRTIDDDPSVVVAFFQTFIPALDEQPVQSRYCVTIDDPPIERQQLSIVRITRLLV